MAEFWEENFVSKQEMWGLEPAHAAVVTAAYFSDNGVKSLLIPGIGYGRNAQPFLDKDISVTGIEISETAIGLAKQHFGQAIQIYHGSVTDMPFDDKKYDGIFCHGLIHLLDAEDRAKLIAACYAQLNAQGYMVFTMITKAAVTYGQGVPKGKDRFEMFGGVNMFFYDLQTIAAEFAGAGLVDVTEIEENYPFYLITCKKA